MTRKTFLIAFLILFLGTGIVAQARVSQVMPGVIHSTNTDGPVWQIEVVDSNIGEGSGAEVSLALDSTGAPHVSYADWSVWPDINLKYAHRTQSGWITQTASACPCVEGFESSLALDSGNNPHIAYPNGNYDLLYTWWTGTQWGVRVIGWGPYFGSDPSLALDSSNTPHISFYSGWPNYYGLKYAYWTGGTWNIQTVDGPGDVGNGNSLVLDSSERPRISYCGLNDGSVKYAAWTGAMWDIRTIEVISGSCEKTSLSLDSSSDPHVAYAVRLPSGTDYEVRYARWTGNNWELEPVDQSGGQGISMALGFNNIPHLSYLGEITHTLLYAYRSETGWHTELVDSGPIHPDTSIGVEGVGVHIAYYALYAPTELRYAYLPPRTRVFLPLIVNNR